MNAPFHNRPYPGDALHHLGESTLREVGNIVQASPALIASSLLSGMSAVVQRIADVRLPFGSIKPASVYTFCIAESGDGKTTVDELIMAPIKEHDRAKEHQFVGQRDSFEKEIDRWQSTRGALLKRLSRLSENGAPTATIEKKLNELNSIKPKPPRLRRLIRQDLTHAALMASLEGDGEAVFINASEGDAALGSDLFRQNPSAVNMIWGGESRLDDRATESRLVTNPRCTMSVMVQEEVLKQFMAKRGDVLRGSGFFARCLVTRPMSMVGNRVISSEPFQWTYLVSFHNRLRDLLEEGDLMLVAGVPRCIVEFDDEARHRWAYHANAVETMLREGGYLSEVRDFGAKLMEHVARVAAILHVFFRQEGLITVDTIERAFSIVWWHAEEFRLLFSPSLEVPQAVIDADKIADYLFRQVRCLGYWAVPRNIVHRYGPVRGLSRFGPAIDELVRRGNITVCQANRKAPLIINLNPNYYP